jgi:hypothetical protein
MQERQTELIQIIEAYSALEKSSEWETIKTLVHAKSLASIERQILNESLSQKIDTDKIYRLQGEWKWAKRYTDTGFYVGQLTRELEAIKKQLHE